MKMIATMFDVTYKNVITFGILFLCIQSILANDQKVIVKRTDLATCLGK